MNQPTPPPPFSYVNSHNVPELLKGLNCSFAISTYQTGKVVIFSAQDEDRLIQLPRNFPRPMGMAYQDGKWAIALLSEILVTANTPAFAQNYPPQPNTYDAMFIPRQSYYTGTLDLHDLTWAGEKLIGVNTMFSCLMEVDNRNSFKPIWKPDFVTDLVPEDRCHLNGLALKSDRPKYVTALSNTNSDHAWKEHMLTSGILMDVESNEIILENLPVPHSPRLYEDGLYMLLSGTGEVVKVDVESRKYEVICKLNGFLRGMDRIGDYLFVAMSKLRQGSSLFKDAPIAKESVRCGVSIIYLPTGNQIGYVLYNNTVDELFEVKILPGMTRPNILNLEKGFHATTISSEGKVFYREQPKEEQTDQSQPSGQPQP